MLVCSIALYGCSGDGDHDNEAAEETTTAQTFDVTGRWGGAFQSNRGGSGTTVVNLIQSGQTVTGDVTHTSLSGPFISCFPGTIEATISGNEISGEIRIPLTGGGGVTDFEAVIDPSGDAMSGTYSVAGGLCAGDTGTFELTRTNSGAP
jgi:hypothetical protein